MINLVKHTLLNVMPQVDISTTLIPLYTPYYHHIKGTGFNSDVNMSPFLAYHSLSSILHLIDTGERGSQLKGKESRQISKTKIVGSH